MVLLAIAAAFWFADVQAGGPWVMRNLLPLVVLVLLSFLTLKRGNGRWSGAGMRMPLGTLGFAIPALGLSVCRWPTSATTGWIPPARRRARSGGGDDTAIPR